MIRMIPTLQQQWTICAPRARARPYLLWDNISRCCVSS